MGVNCLIFAGENVDESVGNKFAGPYRVATELRDHGYTVQVVELVRINQYKPLLKKIVNKFVDKDTLWIGFSTNFFHSILGYPYLNSLPEKEIYHRNHPDSDKEIKELVDHAKSLNPNIKFIVGGVRTFNFDHLGFYRFKGYSDKNIVEFTRSCEENKIMHNQIIENLEYKDFNNSQIKFTLNDVFNNEKSLPIEISRGCIFKCKFCNFPLTGKTKFDYIRNFDLIQEDIIRNYELFGVTHYNFAEDTYNDSVYKLESLLENVFSKLPFKITFTAYLRLDLLMRFPEMEDILVESGLKSALFGIETLDPTNAKLIGKGTDPQKQIDKIFELKQDKFKNILCGSGFIVGLPNDSIESIEHFSNWLHSENNPLDDWSVNALTIQPYDYESEIPYQSEFDKNYKKYGYTFSKNQYGNLSWYNTNSKLNQSDMRDIAANIKTESQNRTKLKYGGFRYSRMLDLGYEADQLTHTSALELDQIYDKTKLIREKTISYYNRLLKL